MKPGEFFTWSRNTQVAIVDGRIPADEMRARTLRITYIDRDREFDHIEWELDNSDGLLTKPEYIATGMMVRIRLGYQDGSFPWKAFVINRVNGGAGVYGKGAAAVGDRESRVTYHGRNRNAPGGRTARRSYRAQAPRKTTTKSGKPTKAARTFGATSDVTKHEMLLNQDQGPRTITAHTTSEAVEEIARRNGFEGAFALIQPTEDSIDSGAVTIDAGMSDGQWLQIAARGPKGNERGFVFKIDEQGLHWHSRCWPGAKPILADTLIYGETPDLLEIWMDCDFRLPAPGSISAKGYSYKRRRLMVGELDYDAARRQSNLGISYFDILDDPAKFKALTREEIFPVLAASPGAAKEKSIQRFIARYMRAFQINVRTVGNPKLLAARLVAIQGIGNPIIDGVKYISEARHTMDPSTYVTELKLKHPPKQYQGAQMQRMQVGEPEWDRDKRQLFRGGGYVSGFGKPGPPKLR